MNKINFYYICILSLFLLQTTPTLAQNQYYVDKDATGQNNGSNWSNAWESFAAINWTSISPGDIIYVSGGTYNEPFTFGTSGNSGNLVTVSRSSESGHNGEVVINSNGKTGIDLSGRSYVRINGLSVTNCGTGIQVTTGNTIYIDSIKVRNATGRMVFASGNTGGSWSSGLYIRWCDLNTTTSGQADGIYIQWYWENIEIRKSRIVLANTGTAHMDGIQWSNYVKDIIVENSTELKILPNLTANRDSQGMMLASLMGYAKIYGNVIYCPLFDGKSPCIYTVDYQTSAGTYYIYNNTFVANYSYDIIRVEDPDAWIKNNIFYNQKDPTTGVLWMPYGSNDYSRIAGNLYGQHSGPNSAVAYVSYSNKTMAQMNSMGAETTGTPSERNRVNPLFEDIANGNLSLRAGSPAINAGINLGKPFDEDINGRIRPQTGNWDVGAYQTDGSTTDISSESAMPNSFILSQNFPNPFNPSTDIRFNLPSSNSVRLTIYDITGRKVKELLNQDLSAGVHTVNFDASNLASGTYIYRIQAGSFVQSKKMILLK